MSDARPLRVLHCPYAVAGNAGQLARAERELGLDSRAVAFEKPRLGFEIDEVLWGDRAGTLSRECARARLLIRTLRDFDVVHFNFGSTLFPQQPARRPARGDLRGYAWELYGRLLDTRDLPLLRAARKAVFVTFQGDDARQGDYVRDHFETSAIDAVEPGYYSAVGDRAKRRRIARFDRHTDGIYALNPDLLRVLPQAKSDFLPYASVDPRDLTPRMPRGEGAPVVVHAPSHRAAKGTAYVLEAVERLRSEGVELELLLVEALPFDEARELYSRADVAVDQLLYGWYGAFAVEAMALGKPVIAYLRDDDLRYLPSEMREELPVVAANPSSIYDVLRELLTSGRHRLGELGARSRAYVERWHDPRAIARRLRDDYERALDRRE